MKSTRKVLGFLLGVVLGAVGFASGQPQAQTQQEANPPQVSSPLAPGANSPAESAALAYMRTAMRAQFLYKQKHHQYAPSLSALIGSGSFTRRMARTDRGDYKVRYSATAEAYSLSMVPATFDEQHRAFFVDQEGPVKVEADHPATAQSPPLLTRKR